MDWLDYNEKLGMSFDDEQKLLLLKNKIHIFLYHLAKQLSFSDYRNNTFIDYFVKVGYVTNSQNIIGVIESMDCVNTLTELISKYIAFSNTAHKHLSNKTIIDIIKNFLPTELENLHIQYEIIEDSSGCFIVPKGAKELDDALVSEPLEWLKDYPKAHKTYCIALKQYSDGIYIRDVADNLRKALEDFLREFLGNNNDFNKNKKEVEAYLKSQNVDSHFITILVALLNHYYLLNNEVAKHNDKMDKKYLEFLLYQTGIFIRTLIVVKREENK